MESDPRTINANKNTVVLITAFNEDDVIDSTVNAVREIPSVSRVIVVDDGSADQTTKKAKEAGAQVITLSKNSGKGKALKKGLEEIDEAFILLLDADLGEYAIEGKKVLDPVLKGDADLAIANFPKPKVKGGFGIAKGFGRWAIRYFTGYNMIEPLSGQRALRSSLMKELKIAPGFGVEVAMTIDAIRKGYKVVEVPTNMSHRESTRSYQGFVHRGKQFIDIFKVAIIRIFRR